MRALVTGAAGFIGGHVVRALIADGVEARALILPGEDTRNLDGLPVERIEGNVLDRGSVDRALKGCDWLFHLAALYRLWEPKRGLIRQVNVEGTRNVLAAGLGAGTSKVVYTSSIIVFGGQGPDRDAVESSPFAFPRTGDAYSLSKREAHRVATEFAERGLDLVIVAPCGPIGPGDVGPTPTGRFLLSLFNYPVCPMIATINNVVDVRDVAQGHLLAAKKGRRGESYLLGHENLCQFDLARMAMEITGVKKPILPLPLSVAWLGSHFLLWAAEYLTRQPPLITPAGVEIAAKGLRADCRKATTELSLPQTPIRAALRDALVWFARHGYLRDPRVVKNLSRGSSPQA